jgi:predicted O-methyltransferase YrrM
VAGEQDRLEPACGGAHYPIGRGRTSGTMVMDRAAFEAVDAYIVEGLLPVDEALEAALQDNARADLPAIDVSPAQGRLLQLLARMIGARRILEIGTLGGYSTIWLARGLSDGGRLTTLEADPHHAAVARGNIARAGLAEVVEVRVGPALETLPGVESDGLGPFDLVFIDADKPNNAAYLDWAIRLARPGGVIIVDNVVREGAVLQSASDDPRVSGARDLFDRIHGDPRLAATAIQTVGAKGWDGFALIVVD